MYMYNIIYIAIARFILKFKTNRNGANNIGPSYLHVRTDVAKSIFAMCLPFMVNQKSKEKRSSRMHEDSICGYEKKKQQLFRLKSIPKYLKIAELVIMDDRITL